MKEWCPLGFFERMRLLGNTWQCTEGNTGGVYLRMNTEALWLRPAGIIFAELCYGQGTEWGAVSSFPQPIKYPQKQMCSWIELLCMGEQGSLGKSAQDVLGMEFWKWGCCTMLYCLSLFYTTLSGTYCNKGSRGWSLPETSSLFSFLYCGLLLCNFQVLSKLITSSKYLMKYYSINV